jgi:hypothetical protein
MCPAFATLSMEGGVRKLILSVMIVAAAAAAAQPPTGGTVELRPGVVIDPERRVAYVMNPRGGIDAVGLGRGELVWHSDDAERPLSSSGDVIVAQAEPAKPRAQGANELQVRVLDARTGRQRVAAQQTLPPGTRANVVDTAEGAFVVRARSTAAEATLVWEFVEGPRQGVPPGTFDSSGALNTEERPALEAAPAKAPSTAGVVRVDLRNGRASSLPPGESLPSWAQRRADVPAEMRVASIPGDQFLSADGRHVMTSTRVADDRTFDKYQWTVFERSGGRRLGTLRDYRSHAAFIVVGSSIVYEIGPFERRTERGVVTEPLRVRAVDLSKGEEQWARAVRDTEYRGPLPP